MIQPLVLERLPCYDFTPIIEPTFGRALLSVRLRTSGVPDSHGVTGGVYKARERIHRGMLIRDYFPVAAAIDTYGIEKDDIILAGRQAIDGDTAQVGP